jgi:TatD DNase family protein
VSVPDGVPAVAPFVDSHVHLAGEAFDPDRDEVIARARVSGCRAMVVIGESLDAAARAQRLAAAYPDLCVFTAGIHPHDAATFDQQRTPEALRAFVRDGAVALGECGLDYHYDHSPREVQRRVFDAHLALAAELDRPVVVHTRDAEADTIDALRAAASAGVRGVLHCFGGGPALADAAMAAGWWVSFSGIVTFKKWDGDALIRAIPAGRWLVESDAPFLAPVPYRGKRNEPAHVARTLAHVAAARGLTLAAAAQEALAATRACFALPPALGAA